jgi:hypothetical protein
MSPADFLVIAYSLDFPVCTVRFFLEGKVCMVGDCFLFMGRPCFAAVVGGNSVGFLYELVPPRKDI